MRFRNIIPLLIFFAFTVPLGLGFLYLWLGNTAVICGMQFFHTLLLYVTFRAGINSTQKNFHPHLDLGREPYLPVKVNLALYLLVGLPVVYFFADSMTVLMIAYGVSLVGFSMAYVSGVTYVTRSGEAIRKP